MIRLAESRAAVPAPGGLGAHDLIGLLHQASSAALRPRLPRRGPAGFDVSDRFGFCPFEGGTLELSGVFAGSFSFCSKAVSRAVSDPTCSHNARIKASFCAWESVVKSGRGGTTIRRLNPAPSTPSSPAVSACSALDHTGGTQAR